MGHGGLFKARVDFKMRRFRVARGPLIISLLGIALYLDGPKNLAHGLVLNLKATFTQEKTEPELLLRNWGLENQESNSHIDIRNAWKINRGTKKIIVAVIDTGIDANHPDLKDNLWHKAGTDEYGFDFVTGQKNPKDYNGHGTHIAGIIGATAKAKAGASGVAPNVSIMAIRYVPAKNRNEKNTDTIANTLKAINYAIENGANIINYSGGGSEFSAEEKKAIQRAQEKGILFVAAAGNEYQDTDTSSHLFYPAAYDLPNIISVASTNIKNQLVPSSNYGLKHVQVAAPGENIYSTFPDGKYGYLTGTSQATAFVSGLAALMLSENSSLSPQEIRKVLMESVDKVKGLERKVASEGKINAYKAMKMGVSMKQNLLLVQRHSAL